MTIIVTSISHTMNDVENKSNAVATSVLVHSLQISEVLEIHKES